MGNQFYLYYPKIKVNCANYPNQSLKTILTDHYLGCRHISIGYVTTVRARMDSFTELPVSSYSLTPWTGLTGQIGIYSFRVCLQSIPLDIAFRFKSSANTIPASLHNWLATL